jgi:PPOX class probable F420-dependent enzyme
MQATPADSADPAHAAAPRMPPSHRALLDAPVGVLATVGPDGVPQATAVWFLYDEPEGVLRFSLSSARQKTKNLRVRPVASFLVLDPASPYRTVELRGRTEIAPDEDYALADRVGRKYGADLRQMDAPGTLRMAVTLIPTRVNTWGE